MIILTIGGIETADYLTDNYEITRTSETKSSSSFENYDGSTVITAATFKTTISASLEGVPDDIARSIAGTVKTAEPFSVTYTSPEETEDNFLCTNFSAEVDDPGFSGETVWNIRLTLVSQSSDNTSGDGL